MFQDAGEFVTKPKERQALYPRTEVPGLDGPIPVEIIVPLREGTIRGLK